MKGKYAPWVLKLILFLILVGSRHADANTVFSQLPKDGGVSYGSDLNGQEVLDEFMLLNNCVIDGIRWWGGEGFPPNPVAELFTIRFYNDDSGSPEISPFLTLTVENPARTMTELNAGRGQPIFEYQADLSQVVPLSGGVTYYLSIVSHSNNWGWAVSKNPGDSGRGQFWWRGTADLDSPWTRAYAALSYEFQAHFDNIIEDVENGPVNKFVTRFYNECLKREPDQIGFDGWSNALKNGSITGADLAEAFILSPEFANRGTSDEEFLTILYRAFFNRQPDTDGFNGWLSALQSETKRSIVLEGFLYSDEFSRLCNQYGIKPYSLDLVENYVTRFYRECLNREPDQAGLDGWVNGLKNGWVTGGDVAESFIMSPEYTNLGTSDEEFLETLYQAFFNRQPDTVGFNGWLSALRNGMSRSTVLEGFISSDEFFKLCSDYGIDAVDKNKIDNDGDGYTENQGDCNDMASNIHPGAAEICGDRIDQDCNGSDLPCTPLPENIDDDRDGYTEAQGDCNDFDANIHPNADEICGDHIDQDCNGSDLICTQTDPSKPWIGNWLLINFLSDDDNGVWSSDDTQGIGMTAVISDNQWVEKDENNGCAVSYSYSMSANLKYNKQVVTIGDGCGFSQYWSESGRLVFSDDNNIMIDYFDLLPGDSIIAFKWLRQ